MYRSSFVDLNITARGVVAAAFSLFVVLSVVSPVSAQSHCTNWADRILDTSDNCTNEPFRDRSTGVETFTWKGHEYLMFNGGNELFLYNIDDPANPVWLASVRIDELNPVSDALFGGITDVGVHNLWLFTDGGNDSAACGDGGLTGHGHCRVSYSGIIDADPANELNTELALVGTTLVITDAGGTLSADLSGLQDGFNDADADSSNELQNLASVLGLGRDTVIVTGAARGIGLALSRFFADAGATLCVADVDEAALGDVELFADLFADPAQLATAGAVLVLIGEIALHFDARQVIR